MATVFINIVSKSVAALVIAGLMSKVVLTDFVRQRAKRPTRPG